MVVDIAGSTAVNALDGRKPFACEVVGRVNFDLIFRRASLMPIEAIVQNHGSSHLMAIDATPYRDSSWAMESMPASQPQIPHYSLNPDG
jgi:hypothetical protein